MKTEKMKWISIIGFIVTWLIVGITYWFGSENLSIPKGSTLFAENLKFISAWFAVLGIISSVLLSTFNSLEASHNISTRINFDKTENSFAYMERWDSSSLVEARDIARELKRLHIHLSPSKLLLKINGPAKEDERSKMSETELKEQEKIQRSVITMFNYFEEIELSIKENRVNEEILQNAFGEVYVDIYERLKPWIVTREGKELKSNLEQLYKKWNNKS